MYDEVSLRHQVNYQSHHTGIETRQANHLLHQIRATNRTILELKRFWRVKFTVPVIYQSHHTGIETFREGNKAAEKWTTNRTILELKPINFWLLKTSLIRYQSHHTGIETADLTAVLKLL